MERYEWNILGRGVRKSCAYMIGVGRWTERYMDDVNVTVQACQEPVKSHGVWPEQADLQAIRARRETQTHIVSVSSVAEAAKVSNDFPFQNSDTAVCVPEGELRFEFSLFSVFLYETCTSCSHIRWVCPICLSKWPSVKLNFLNTDFIIVPL